MEHENFVIDENGNLPIPEDNTVFKLQSYWDERFKHEKTYDWLAKWSNAEKLIAPLLNKDDKILMVGCGNSAFSQDMYDAGYHNIINIDFSSVVIEHMREIHQITRPHMQWLTMDMTDLQYPDDFFDVVIDKAAMDALMVDEGDVWYPEEHVIESVDKMSLGIARVLKRSNGRFLQISFAQPHFRTKYLMGYRAEHKECSFYQSHSGHSERYNWDLSHEVIPSDNGGCIETFLYKMIRNQS